MKDNKKTNTILLKRIITFACTIAIVATTFLVSGCNHDNEEQISSIKVETPFAELEYPSKWKENLNIEWTGTNNSGNLIFFAKNEGGEEKEIFEIHFNEDAQIPVGVLHAEDGSNIYIGYSLTDPQFDENWSNAEKDMFYAMQNDVNFMIQQLSKDSSFTAE